MNLTTVTKLSFEIHKLLWYVCVPMWTFSPRLWDHPWRFRSLALLMTDMRQQLLQHRILSFVNSKNITGRSYERVLDTKILNTKHEALLSPSLKISLRIAYIMSFKYHVQQTNHKLGLKQTRCELFHVCWFFLILPFLTGWIGIGWFR